MCQSGDKGAVLVWCQRRSGLNMLICYQACGGSTCKDATVACSIVLLMNCCVFTWALPSSGSCWICWMPFDCSFTSVIMFLLMRDVKYWNFQGVIITCGWIWMQLKSTTATSEPKYVVQLKCRGHWWDIFSFFLLPLLLCVCNCYCVLFFFLFFKAHRTFCLFPGPFLTNLNVPCGHTREKINKQLLLQRSLHLWILAPFFFLQGLLQNN